MPLSALLGGLLVLILFAASYLWWRKARRRVDFDALDGEAFEAYCADLLARNGYRDIRRTEVRGDHGIDLLAEKDGVRYAIQCKRYTGNVGNKAVQEAYSGCDIYEADRPVVLTNQYFTPQAAEDAEALGVLLWDRDELLDLIRGAGGGARHDLSLSEEDEAAIEHPPALTAEERGPRAAGLPILPEEAAWYSPEEGRFPQGQYVTGEEIPTGEYLAVSYGEVTGRILLYADYVAFLEDRPLSNDLFAGEAHLTLQEEGMVLSLHAARLERL